MTTTAEKPNSASSGANTQEKVIYRSGTKRNSRAPRCSSFRSIDNENENGDGYADSDDQFSILSVASVTGSSKARLRSRLRQPTVDWAELSERVEDWFEYARTPGESHEFLLFSYLFSLFMIKG
jgi:hypothetical protein